jgi:hypothetical protein
MNKLSSEVIARAQLPTHVIWAMYNLYATYYDGTNPEIFLKDLSNKDAVILLWDETNQVQGFTTISLLQFEFNNQPQQAIFSGDTIINHRFWGEQTLPLAWCRFAGQIKAAAPAQPLYWFLIVKGYRTYRYLPIFGKEFYPNYRYPTPASYQQIMDDLASTKFGDAYNPATGLIRFPTSQGHLRENWADVKTEFRKKPDINYFLQRNPEYYQGDELVCLMELREDNMRSHARRGFLEGFLAATPQIISKL